MRPIRSSRLRFLTAAILCIAPGLGAQTPAIAPDVPARYEAPASAYDYVRREEMIPIMVPLAMQDGCRLLNPRPTSMQDMEALYRAAL